MTACLVLDASPAGLTVTQVRLGPPVVLTSATLDPRRQLQELQATRAEDVAAFVHRLLHAPPGAPEVDGSPDLAAVAAAGCVEPEETCLRLDILAAARRRWPEHRHLVVYDDAWFAELPEPARSYALPPEPVTPRAYRRAGRHGPVHRLAAAEAGAERVVSVLIGPESSAAAVLAGRPVDITAGATGLEGLPGYRTAGDLDPAAVLYLLDPLGESPGSVERALTIDGGVAGVSGGKRALPELRAAGDEASAEALRWLARRVRRAVGALAAVLDGLDVLVLSGAPVDLDDLLAEDIAGGLAYLLAGRKLVRTPLTPALAAARVAADS